MRREFQVTMVVLGSLCGCSDEPTSPPKEPVESQFAWEAGDDAWLDGQMHGPRNLTIDPAAGKIYVWDNHQFVQTFSEDGTFVERRQFPYVVAGGFTFNPAGSFLIADTYNDRVLEYGTDGSLIRSWGETGTGPGQFSRPGGIAVRNGRIYVVDTRNSRVQVFDLNGNFIRAWGGVFGSLPGQFQYPFFIAVDSSDFVYVSDSYRVQKFDSQGNWILVWGHEGTEAGNFTNIPGLAIAENGDVLTLEHSLRVQRFNGNGTFIDSWAGEGDPSYSGLGLVEDAGRVYTLGLRNFGVQTYSLDGTFLNEFGTRYQSGPLQFDRTYLTAVAPQDGTIYAGSWDGRIQHISEAGAYLGEWALPYGTGSPGDLAVSPGGAIYVLRDDSYWEAATLTVFSAAGDSIDGWNVPHNAKGLNVDEQGRVWLIDYANTRIDTYNREESSFSSWGEIGVDPGELLYPVSMSVRDGNVVVCDAKAIALFSIDGTFKRNLTTWSEGEQGFEMVALGDQGIVFAAVRDNLRKVSLFDLSGTQQEDITWDADYFYDLASGPGGAFYLLTGSPDRLVKFDVK